MGRRGPKPAPTRLKLLRNVRGDRVSRDEPTPPTGLPEPPEFLDFEARSEWERIVPLLSAMGVLTSVDGAALAIYCQSFSEMVRAERQIADMGLLVECGNGEYVSIKANPAVSIAAKARSTCARLLAEFGATPSSRSRVTVQSKPRASQLEDFLRRRESKGKAGA